jgi:hypothetical protein
MRIMVGHNICRTTARARLRLAPRTERSISAGTHVRSNAPSLTGMKTVSKLTNVQQSRWDLYIWTATTARAGTELNGLIPLQSVGWKQCIRWAARPPKPVHNGRPGLRIVTRPSPLVSLPGSSPKKKRLYQAFANKTHVCFNQINYNSCEIFIYQLEKKVHNGTNLMIKHMFTLNIKSNYCFIYKTGKSLFREY